MGKGSGWERDLVDGLQDCGYEALRAPASGSATSDDKPDLLAGSRDEGRYIGLELKYSSSDATYVDKEEVVALENFCWTFGATPLLGFRWDGRTFDTNWYLIRPKDTHVTDSGSHRLKHSSVDDRNTIRLSERDELPLFGGNEEDFFRLP